VDKDETQIFRQIIFCWKLFRAISTRNGQSTGYKFFPKFAAWPQAVAGGFGGSSFRRFYPRAIA
jgi:hypothetical protein